MAQAFDALGSRGNEFVLALGKCEPGAVKSMKRQINAIAAGDHEAAASRLDYEDPLRSAELRSRVGALIKRG